ncbi:MAG: thiolase family protein [Firmicutes bacterium]|nr:thiolase family protein [Bacillota bacterium]
MGNNREIVFVDAARTAFGKMGGGLAKVPAMDLGAHVIKALVEKNQLLERTKVDDVFVGCAFTDALTNTPGRYLTLNAGLPEDVSGTYIEMQCGSAITAMNYAAYKMMAGASDVIIVGGVESHSNRIAKFSMSAEPYKLQPPTAIPNRLTPNLEQNTPMIKNNDLMAEKWNISRMESDEFALRSQELMAKAIETGFTGPEIVPYIFPATKKRPEIVIDKDEHPKPGTTLEGLQKLRPVFEGGVTTAGNASGVNDGAAFVIMMTAEKAKECGFEPIARWVGGASMGCQANLMGIGASYSTLKALKSLNMKLSDLDVIECNEAFAAQNLACIKDMQEQTGEIIDMKRWNPNGGAIAIGHPNGASGGRVAWFCMNQLMKTGGRYGAFTSCCGGGQGTTAIIENLRI